MESGEDRDFCAAWKTLLVHDEILVYIIIWRKKKLNNPSLILLFLTEKFLDFQESKLLLAVS